MQRMPSLGQRRNSLPSLGKNSSPPLSPVSTSTMMTRRNSTPSLHPASAPASYDHTEAPSRSPPRKFRKSGTVSSLAQAGSALAGAPGNALRRAVKRLGGKSQKTGQVSTVQDEMVKQLKQDAKAHKKRLHELYSKRSCLCIHQMPVASHQCLGDTDVGMVRLAYSKIRSLREAKDYETVYKRNSWKDLVGDLRHGIRVCMKAQAFLNVLMESSKRKNEPISPSWCVNASLEKQRMWMDLISFMEKPSIKSQADDFSKLELDQELANYKAMIMSSPSKAVQDLSTSSPDAMVTFTLQPRAPSSPPPTKCSPMVAKLANRSVKSKD